MAQASSRTGTSALYRAVWRWHFSAGLIILPFVILIAITGAIYLFKDEYTLAAQSDLRIVTAEETAPSHPLMQGGRLIAVGPRTRC